MPVDHLTMHLVWIKPSCPLINMMKVPRLQLPLERTISVPASTARIVQLFSGCTEYEVRSGFRGDFVLRTASSHGKANFQIVRNHRTRGLATVGYPPTPASLLARHDLKRTHERVPQEGESLLHPPCSPAAEATTNAAQALHRAVVRSKTAHTQ